MVGSWRSDQLCDGSVPVGVFAPERLRGGGGMGHVGGAPQLKVVSFVGEVAMDHVNDGLLWGGGGGGHVFVWVMEVVGNSAWMGFMDGGV